MDPIEYRERIAELVRQIELTEEFLNQRKKLSKQDRDLQSKLRTYKSELAQIIQIGPYEDLANDLIVD